MGGTSRRLSGETIFKRLMFGIGLVSIVVMVFTFHVTWDQVCSALFGAWWLPVAVLGMWAPLYLVSAYAWLTILRGQGECGVRLPIMYKWTVTGFALNSLTPMGVLGSEPYKIVVLKERVGVGRATSSVLLFSMTHIYTHFWFWLTAAGVYAVLAATGDVPMNAGLGVVLAFGAAFSYGGIYIFRKGYRNGFVLKMLHGIGHVPGLRRWARRMEDNHGETIAMIDRQISQLRGQNPKVFRKSFFLEYTERILQSFEVFFVLLSMGMADGSGVGAYALLFVHSFLILAFTSLFANLLGFIPMQLGTREGGYALSATVFGLTTGIGMTVSIVCRLREIVWDGIGLLLMRVADGGRDLNGKTELSYDVKGESQSHVQVG